MFLFRGNISQPTKGCFTTADSPSNDTCVFPFQFKKEEYTGCTTKSDPDGRYWCSTKVDENGKHIGGKGYWGYCSALCPK